MMKLKSVHSHEREKDLKEAISWALGPEQRDPEDMLRILENDWYTQLGNRGKCKNDEKLCFISFSVFEIWFTIRRSSSLRPDSCGLQRSADTCMLNLSSRNAFNYPFSYINIRGNHRIKIYFLWSIYDQWLWRFEINIDYKKIISERSEQRITPPNITQPSTGTRTSSRVNITPIIHGG